MRPVVQLRSLVASSTTSIAAAQTTGAAGNLVLNGSTVVAGVAILDGQRRVSLTSAGNLSAITFTIYGTDDNGAPVQESLAGPNINTVSSVYDYKTVTRIAASAAVGTSVSAGTTAIGASEAILLDNDPSTYISLFLTVEAGAGDWTVQFTGDDLHDPTHGPPYRWFNHVDLTNKVANTTGTIISPVGAVRLLTNSGTGTARLLVRQTAK